MGLSKSSGLALRRKAAEGSDMSQDQTPPDPQDRVNARNKLMGRAMVVLLLGLVAVYVYFTFRSQG
jgi:hypothetical protein